MSLVVMAHDWGIPVFILECQVVDAVTFDLGGCVVEAFSPYCGCNLLASALFQVRLSLLASGLSASGLVSIALRFLAS